MKITGILKKEEIKKFKRRDGSDGKSKNIYIEPEGSIYPIMVSTSDVNLKVGNIGDRVELEVALYPYFFQDGQRRKAHISYYIPEKK